MTSLTIQTSRIANKLDDAPELVLIHGWGVTSRIWDALVSKLSHRYHITLVDLPGYAGSDYHSGCYAQDILLPALNSVLPTSAILCGWSLGANIAFALAQRYPERCVGVISIASNPHFIRTEDWPGVSHTLADEAVSQLHAQPDVYMAYFFGVCASGRTLDKTVWRLLKQMHQAQPVDQQVLLESLRLVYSIDMREVVQNSQMPVCLIHAAHDALSPPELQQHMAEWAPQTNVEVIDDAPHVVLLSHPDQLSQSVMRSVLHIEQRDSLDKARVAQSFNGSALTYDAVAQLQQSSSDALLSLLDDVAVSPRSGDVMTVLDLACGTGYAMTGLAARFPDARLLGVDLAHNMLSASRVRVPDPYFACADFEQLPLIDDSVDVLFSNMGFQWALDIGDVFHEVQRVLKPGGVCVFSTFLPDTLCELRAAWQAVDPDTPRVNEFVALDDVRDALNTAGLTTNTWRIERTVKSYPSAMALMKELKALGAHTSYQSRAGGLTGRRVFEAVEHAYARDEVTQGYPATYQVLHAMVVAS